MQEAFYESMEENERINYHIAAAEYFCPSDLSLVPQDVLFTIAHHYNVAIHKFQQQLQAKTANQTQIQHIVKIYYEAAKV